MQSITGNCDGWAGQREKPVDEGQPLPPEDLAARASSNQLIDQLYRAHAPALVRKLGREAANRDEAQDIVQEIFARLARLGGQLLQIERPSAYLHRIAANLVKDRAKSGRRWPADFYEIDESGPWAPDPLLLLESRDMLNRIETAVMRLKPRTREIFMAHRIEGLSYAEIAGRTGLSTKGVEKQMSKALRQLDQMLNR